MLRSTRRTGASQGAYRDAPGRGGASLTIRVFLMPPLHAVLLFVPLLLVQLATLVADGVPWQTKVFLVVILGAVACSEIAAFTTTIALAEDLVARGAARLYGRGRLATRLGPARIRAIRVEAWILDPRSPAFFLVSAVLDDGEVAEIVRLPREHVAEYVAETLRRALGCA